MKAISFSLYGCIPKYTVGAARNVVLAKQLLPDYTCVFYYDQTVPHEVIDQITSLGAQCRPGACQGGMFWRFLINDDQGTERYIVRDVDSRISEREVAAVREWEASSLGFHIMRDHPAHFRQINGGLWGARRGAIPSMRQLIDDWGPNGNYSDDQDFLCRIVWPMVKSNCMQHDSIARHHFAGAKPFPTKRNGSPRFVGEVWDVGPDGQGLTREFDVIQINVNKD